MYSPYAFYPWVNLSVARATAGFCSKALSYCNRGGYPANVIGNGSPLALPRAVFFYAGKINVDISAAGKSRGTLLSKFVHSTEPYCYTYVENCFKNNTGANLKQANKVVPVYAVSDSYPRCFVYLLDEGFHPRHLSSMFSTCGPRQNMMSMDCGMTVCLLRKRSLGYYVPGGCIQKKTNHT